MLRRTDYSNKAKLMDAGIQKKAFEPAGHPPRLSGESLGLPRAAKEMR